MVRWAISVLAALSEHAHASDVMVAFTIYTDISNMTRREILEEPRQKGPLRGRGPLFSLILKQDKRGHREVDSPINFHFSIPSSETMPATSISPVQKEKLKDLASTLEFHEPFVTGVSPLTPDTASLFFGKDAING